MHTLWFWNGRDTDWPASATFANKYLGPTKPSIWWVPGTLSLEIKRVEREANHPSFFPLYGFVSLLTQMCVVYRSFVRTSAGYNVCLLDILSKTKLFGLHFLVYLSTQNQLQIVCSVGWDAAWWWILSREGCKRKSALYAVSCRVKWS
jgi:hypothetical protein